MGLSTAWAAARAGKRVLLVDPRFVLNEHNASNDESKVFRLAYGAMKEYVPLAKRALHLWRALEDESGASLLHQSGLLMFGPPGGFALQSARTLLELGEPVEVVRGPVEGFAGVEEAVLDPSGGWLDARACLLALEARAIAHGAEVRRGVEATRVRAGEVALDTGEVIEARAVVLAAGFHAPRLAPQLRGRIRVTRQPELFFEPPDDFPVTPVFAAFEEGFYGFPRMKGAVKVADHEKGASVIDFEKRAPPTDAEVGKARAWLARRLPALADRPLLRSRVCLYDNTVDDAFVLERQDGVVVGAGFSGHGFKFGPAIGERLLELC